MQPKSCSPRVGAFALFALILGTSVLFPSKSQAQYTLGTSDAGGTSSLTGTTNWFPSGAPAPDTAAAASYTYTAGPNSSGTLSLRTPTGSDSYTIYANPLTINSGVAIGTKGYGAITYNNLVLNGGGLYNSSTGGPGTSNNAYVYGNINLTANSQMRAGSAGAYIYVYATITNTAGSNPTLSFTAGGTVQLDAQNTFSGNVTVLNSSPDTTLQLGTNNALPATAGLTLNGGSANNSIFDLNGYSTVIGGLAMTSGNSMGYVTNSAAGKTSNLTISNDVLTTTVNGPITDNPSSAGTVALTDAGTATVTLNGTNTYHGGTTISAGTLALGASGAISNSPDINIAGGATFDVSAITSYYQSSNTALSASGTGVNPATINGQSGGSVSLGAQPISLTFTPASSSGDTANPSLVVAQSDLYLNNNAFTVNNASGTPLGAGTYQLIQVNDGNIYQSGSPAYALTVTGSGLAAQTTAAIQISGGSVNLIVSANSNPAPVFSHLTASPTVSIGTASITLSGKVSSGSIYPANGEPVTVSINGNVQATTIDDNTGDFSISYNLSGIPASSTPYTITYSYGGDGSLGSAMNTATTLTVQPATPVFSGLTASQTISYGAAGVTLAGKLSAPGPFYPAIGESITISVNGNAQNTTISDSTGDFSLNYNLSSLPESATSYPIIYSYGGDASLGTATNGSTTLTVETNTLTENQVMADVVDFSSLNTPTNWTPATTVSPTDTAATNYNFITAVTLRTPIGSSNYTVNANALTIVPGGSLVFKGYGLVTVSNLVLAGGNIKNAGTGGSPDESLLAGYINLTASSSLTPDALNTSIVNIESLITNAPGTSPTLTCSGGGTVILSAQNTFNGNVVVAGAAAEPTILQLGTNNALPVGTSLTLDGASGAASPGVLDLNGFTTTVTNLTFTSTAPNYGYVTNSAFGTTGTLTLGNGNATETLQYGSILDNTNLGGAVALAKMGAGTLTLAAYNPYDGNTTISAGTLALGSSGSIPNSADIAVAAGATFDVSQTSFVLNSGQILGGGGTVIGPVQANGTIAPSGTLTVNGDLTLYGNLTFSLNTSLAQSNDMVNVSGALNNYGSGTLTINNVGPALAAGEKFTLFNQPLNGGNNLTIVSPSGAVFNNNLAVDGSVTVVSAPVGQPQITSLSLSGTQLIMNGFNGASGEQYYLLTSTNLALPLAQWTPIATNTFGGNSFSVTNAVNAAAPQNFYILKVP